MYFFYFRTTVYKALDQDWVSGQDSNLPRTGRKRPTTVLDDRILVRASLQNRKRTIPELRSSWDATLVNISESTVRRRLKEAHLGAYKVHLEATADSEMQEFVPELRQSSPEQGLGGLVMYSVERREQIQFIPKWRTSACQTAGCRGVSSWLCGSNGDMSWWKCHDERCHDLLRNWYLEESIRSTLWLQLHCNTRDYAVPTAHIAWSQGPVLVPGRRCPMTQGQNCARLEGGTWYCVFRLASTVTGLKSYRKSVGNIEWSLRTRTPSNLRELEADIINMWNNILVNDAKTLSDPCQEGLMLYYKPTENIRSTRGFLCTWSYEE